MNLTHGKILFIPESTLYTCVIAIGRVKHVSLISLQVRKDWVVLKGLDIVGTAEERDYRTQHKNNSQWYQQVNLRI